MALTASEQILQEIYDYSLIELIEDYIQNEKIFYLSESFTNTESTVWEDSVERLQIIEERLWHKENPEVWVPIYKSKVPEQLLKSKVIRYENYIIRASSLLNKSRELSISVFRFKRFLELVNGK
jgi:tRNA nucleotidyltransferase/poly(A) polymerase